MATKNIVPNATSEGSIGTSAKKWSNGYFDSLTVGSGAVDPASTAAALARREVAGGVVLDGAGSAADESIVSANLGDLGTDDISLHFKIKCDANGSSSTSPLLGLSTTSGALTGTRFAAIGATGGFLFMRNYDGSTPPSSYNLGVALGEYVTMSVVRSGGAVTVYINGVSIGVDPYAGTMDLTASYFLVTQNFKGTLSDFTPFNTALTAAQALEIYNAGSAEAWLAENPEYKWGGDLTLPTATQSGMEVFTGASSTGFTALNSSGSGFAGWVLPEIYKTGDMLLVEFDLDVVDESPLLDFRDTTTGLITTVTSASNEGPQTYTIVGEKSFIYTLKSDSNLISFSEGDAPSNITISGFTVTKLGALAHLPLTDDCRQLRDISPNRYDAIASATGVTHLKQKDTHIFRDDNADGTGGSYLVAAADILTASETITGVTIEGRYYAASGAQSLAYRRIRLLTSGADILVQRSNGTTHETIATVTPASVTDFAITVLTALV